MALTRKLMKSMGIEDEKIDQIIEAHAETVDGLKKELATLEANAAKLDEVQKELDAIKNAPGDDFQAKYESEHQAFEAYKAEVAAKDVAREKSEIYKGLLREAGIDEKRIDSVIKVTDLSSFEVKDGAAVDHDATVEGIKGEWADFIVQTKTNPAKVDTPPAKNAGENEPQSLADALRQKYQVKG